MKDQRYKETNDDSIDLVSLLKSIWMERVFVLKITFILMLIGFFVAIFTKNVFTASTTFVPVGQNGSSLTGSLGGLASLAGLSFGSVSNGSEISPTLYPQILSSNSFKKELLNTRLTIEQLDSVVTYSEFYENIYSPGLLANLKKYTIGLPGIILKSIRGTQEASPQVIGSQQSLTRVTGQEHQLMKMLDEQIELSVNEKDGYIGLQVHFPEAVAASELALRIQHLLQSYILDFKTQKSKDELDFLKDRFEEKELEMNNLKITLAKYQDQNTSINTSLGRSQLIDLQNQYNLSFDVYSELAKNVETQRFQLKKDTPIFTVLNPVSIPFKKSGPNRLFILLGYSFFGFVLSIAIVIFKTQWYEFKNEWDNK